MEYFIQTTSPSTTSPSTASSTTLKLGLECSSSANISCMLEKLAYPEAVVYSFKVALFPVVKAFDYKIYSL
nr:hypothetical protein [Aequorivita sp. S2608]